MLLKIPLGYYRQRKTHARENCHPYCLFETFVRTAQRQISVPQFSPLSTVPAYLLILCDEWTLPGAKCLVSSQVYLLISSYFYVNFKKGFNWREVTTEDKFYEMFPNIPRLPQHQGNDYYGLGSGGVRGWGRNIPCWCLYPPPAHLRQERAVLRFSTDYEHYQ